MDKDHGDIRVQQGWPGLTVLTIPGRPLPQAAPSQQPVAEQPQPAPQQQPVAEPPQAAAPQQPVAEPLQAAPQQQPVAEQPQPAPQQQQQQQLQQLQQPQGVKAAPPHLVRPARAVKAAPPHLVRPLQAAPQQQPVAEQPQPAQQQQQQQQQQQLQRQLHQFQQLALNALWDAHAATEESVAAAMQAAESADKARAAVNECMNQLNILEATPTPSSLEPRAASGRLAALD